MGGSDVEKPSIAQGTEAHEKTPLHHGSKRRRLQNHVLLTRVVTFSNAFLEGWDLSVFALILVPVRKSLGLTKYEISVFAVVPMLIGPWGAVAAGLFMDTLGRKRTLMLASLILLAGMLLMSQAQGVVGLALGRTLAHVGHRSGTATTAVFMAELSPSAMRGLLVSVEEILLNAGALCPVIASFVWQDENVIEWRKLCVMAAAAPFITIVCLLVLPLVESPRYLNIRGRTDEARAVLRDVLQNDDSEVETTLRLWSHEAGGADSMGLWKDIGSLVSNRCAWLAAGVWFFREGCGISLLGSFFPYFLHTGGMQLNTVNTWFAFAQLLKTVTLFLPVLWFLDHHGRRAALMLSSFMCCLCAGGASAAFFYGLDGKVVATFFLLFMGSFSLGYGPTPWVYCSEILPNNLRGTSFILARIPAHVLEAVFLLWGPLVFESHAGFLFLAIVATNAAAFAFYSRCPETKGMVLEDLRQSLDAS
mmetsp:Transcript_88003/g.138971  ORF Transcript_88003/g.138971 Transcript_88003/m.138971 type:complete len:476 (-) Transcript_88003:22-1449(-)